MTIKSVSVLLLLALIGTACQPAQESAETATELSQDESGLPPGVEIALIDFQLEEVATGFSTPWAIELLGEDEYLVTDRMGTLHHITDGHSIALTGLPATTTVEVGRHYGGLMDVSLHPRFADNRLVYIAYVNDESRMAVARFRLEGEAAQNLEVVFESNAFSIGSRIAWEDDEHFFVTQGMGGDPTPKPGPQNLEHDGGKIHRLMKDGSVPADNPVFEGTDEPTSIWSYGHRDPQGLYFDREEGLLYSNEHGPLGGDEMNVIEKGGNYGWPRFSYGMNYDRTTVGDLSEEEAGQLTILPVKAWGPDFRVAPSGLERLDNETFPELGGWFVMGSLFQNRLIAYDLASGRTAIVSEKLGRIRDVAQLPSGDLIVLLDSEGLPEGGGRVMRLGR